MADVATIAAIRARRRLQWAPCQCVHLLFRFNLGSDQWVSLVPATRKQTFLRACGYVGLTLVAAVFQAGFAGSLYNSAIAATGS